MPLACSCVNVCSCLRNARATRFYKLTRVLHKIIMHWLGMRMLRPCIQHPCWSHSSERAGTEQGVAIARSVMLQFERLHPRSCRMPRKPGAASSRAECSPLDSLGFATR